MDLSIYFWIVTDIPIKGSLIRFWRSNRRPTCLSSARNGTGEQANQPCWAYPKAGTAGVRSEQASLRRNSSRDNHHTIHRTIRRNTKFDSRHRWQLRNQRTPPRHDCCMASLCHYHCIRVRFGSRRSRRSILRQFSKQYADASASPFEFLNLLGSRIALFVELCL